jgi:hypothetical protein
MVGRGRPHSEDLGSPVIVPSYFRSITSVAAIAALCQMALTAPAAATERCPDLAGAESSDLLAQIDAAARLTWIDQHLSRTGKSARIWQWGWGGGIVLATAANLVPLAFVAPANRIDWYTGAATTIVGIVPLLIAPLDVIEDSRVYTPRSSRARVPPIRIARVSVYCLRTPKHGW